MRGAELVALMLFFPFCLDMLTNSRERWNKLQNGIYVCSDYL